VAADEDEGRRRARHGARARPILQRSIPADPEDYAAAAFACCQTRGRKGGAMNTAAEQIMRIGAKPQRAQTASDFSSAPRSKRRGI
jgi:hypothetical protein